jgi:hypothetical protein
VMPRARRRSSQFDMDKILLSQGSCARMQARTGASYSRFAILKAIPIFTFCYLPLHLGLRESV